MFSDFTPKNNKVYTYPYSFARITNNLGSYNDYKIENFIELDNDSQITDNMTFNIIGIPCLRLFRKNKTKKLRRCNL